MAILGDATDRHDPASQIEHRRTAAAAATASARVTVPIVQSTSAYGTRSSSTLVEGLEPVPVPEAAPLSTASPVPQVQQEKKKESRGRIHLAAGSTGGLLSSALLQPFDVIKTRVQQGRHGRLIDVFQATLGRGQERRLTNLWRGTLPSVLRSSVGSGLYFFTLNEMRTFLARHDVMTLPRAEHRSGSRLPALSGQANLVTGAAARALVGFITMPVTVVKVRYESDLYNYTSIRNAARHIYANHGLRGFFYGAGATAIRDAPHAGLYVYTYELSKSYLSSLLIPPATGAPDSGDEARVVSPLRATVVNFASGLTAGTAATVLTNPFDVMRTRLQLRPAQYRNFLHCAAVLARTEGPRAFLDGVVLRVARKSVSSALTWTLYEYLLASAA